MPHSCFCLGLSHERFNIGISSEAKDAVKPRAQPGRPERGHHLHPGPTGLPGDVEGKQKEAGRGTFALHDTRIGIVDAKISYSGKLLSNSHFPTLGAGNSVVVLVVLLQEIKR